jgi:broad specificity phosphatase PhoE
MRPQHILCELSSTIINPSTHSPIMRGRIHLLRHAEGIHALRGDTSIPDAALSERGFNFAEDLGRHFVNRHSNSAGAIISSPLCRAIQTSLTAFSRILDTTQYPENSGLGAENGLVLTLDANLQEINNLPCNTGTPKDRLAARFPRQETEISHLHPNWHVKTGPLSPLPQLPAQRKTAILERLNQALQELEHRPGNNDVVVVTHQGILELLVPTVNIPAGEWHTFDLVRNGDGQLLLQ